MFDVGRWTGAVRTWVTLQVQDMGNTLGDLRLVLVWLLVGFGGLPLVFRRRNEAHAFSFYYPQEQSRKIDLRVPVASRA